ncbi:MAG: hypothetical protein ABIQ01_04905 [Pseudolysinimonas sp.]
MTDTTTRRTKRAVARSRRTGAGATWNSDHIVVHWIVVALLLGAVVSAGVASIDGLLHAAHWIVPAPLLWTLPVAVDVFLFGTALATLALRRRGAIAATIACVVITLVLVLFSASMNWLYIYTTVGIDTTEGLAGAWIKAAMPVLLLAATEIVAALTSTRNNRVNSPLNRSKKKLAESRAEAKSLRAQLRIKNPTASAAPAAASAPTEPLRPQSALPGSEGDLA